MQTQHLFHFLAHKFAPAFDLVKFSGIASRSNQKQQVIISISKNWLLHVSKHLNHDQNDPCVVGPLNECIHKYLCRSHTNSRLEREPRLLFQPPWLPGLLSKNSSSQLPFALLTTAPLRPCSRWSLPLLPGSCRFSQPFVAV